MDESLGKRLRRVDKDELRPLFGDLLGDEGVDEDRKPLNACVADRGGSLLAVDDPSWPLLLVEWDELAASEPSVLVAMPCGWNARQARSEIEAHAAELAAIGAEQIWAVDAAASFSRPGPRLVDEPDTTIVVPPGWHASVDAHGNVVLERR